MNRITVGIATILALIFAAVGGTTAGFSMAWSDGQANVSGGTSLPGIGVSIVLLILVWLVHGEEAPTVLASPVTRSKRATASFVDVIVTLLGSLSIVGLLPAAVEWLWTARFELYFTRTYMRWTDPFVFVAVLALWAVLLILYFEDSLRNQKQTLGSYIAGLVVVPVDIQSVSFLRVLGRACLVYFAAFGFPITLIIGRDKDGRYWHDLATGFKVVRAGNDELQDAT